MEDFIYDRFRIPRGIKIETVTGGNRYRGRVWEEIARQIYCENGKNGFRDLGHFPSGAPFLFGEDERISISHTEGCYVVATLKVNSESDLSQFSLQSALGVDVENASRDKVTALKERFLNSEELLHLQLRDKEDDIIAWTCKEAMLKAGMNPLINWKDDIVIDILPTLKSSGRGHIVLEGMEYGLYLHTVKSENYIITVACSE